MTKLKTYLTNKKFIYAIILMYFIINLLFLTKFPLVHSDEPWLSGLSRNISQEKSLSVTETFFDLYERNPHAIKILFHLLQIPFIKLLGYNIFTFRLISLVFGALTLFFFYKLCHLLFNSKKMALVSCIMLGIDVQFIYASHFARQEILILFMLILGLYLFFKKDSKNYKGDIMLGTLIGLSIGIHPNSFIISIPFVFLYLYKIFAIKKTNLKNLGVYILTVTIFAVCFVALSLSFDHNFFHNYATYGNQFGVLNPVSSKIDQIKDFYLKLYYGVSGTYYTPIIKLQFYLFIFTLILTLIKLFFIKSKFMMHKITSILLSILAINLGIIAIGRYNQTSIIFLFPLFYILVVYLINDFKKTYKPFVITLLIIALTLNTIVNIFPYLNSDYNSYLDQISKAVRKDDIVLANLNSEYYFDNGNLYDYRNLAFLKEKNLSFDEYIYSHNIEYIIYSDEMDFIYNSRPVWNGIYGNPYFYYDDMQAFLNNRCTLVHKFKDNFYGIRIARYVNKKDWYIRIYRVKE